MDVVCKCLVVTVEEYCVLAIVLRYMNLICQKKMYSIRWGMNRHLDCFKQYEPLIDIHVLYLLFSIFIHINLFIAAVTDGL